ncbi:MAG: trigger factor [Anaerolineales bacterium]
MKIETEPHDNRTLTLTVEVDDEQLQPALRAAARKISKSSRIPGFRPGKAPYEVVLRHYGETALYQQALEDLSQKVYQDALEQEHLEPFAPGQMDIVELKPMKLKFVVPLAPEVELGDHRALRVEFTAPEVADEAIADEIEHLREHQAVLEPAERAAQLTDMVTLDVKAFMNEGENPSDFLLTDPNTEVLLDEKSDWPVPGFAAQIVGMSAGEEKKFDLAFPEAYVNESLRGQVAHFEAKVKEVKQRTLPPVDDELAKSLGDYESLDDLRAKVREELQKQASASVEQDYGNVVVDQLVEQSKITFPPMLLDGEVDDYMKDLDRRLRERKLTLPDYLKIEGKTEEQYREELKPAAEKRLKRSLALGRIVALEGLDVHAEEIDERIEALSTPWGERADEMRKVLQSPRSRELLELELLTDKAVDRLKAIARGEELPAPHVHVHAEGEPAHMHGDEEQPAAEMQAEAAPEAQAAPEPDAQAEPAAEMQPEASTAPGGDSPSGEAAS